MWEDAASAGGAVDEAGRVFRLFDADGSGAFHTRAVFHSAIPYHFLALYGFFI
jgi:hypothetical protein